MPEDYILRLIEQVGAMLARLARLKTAQKPAYITALSLRETGLPFELVKHSAPQTILELLETAGGTQYARAVVLAELLLQDAEVSRATGHEREATVSEIQAHALLVHSIEHLASDEQALYRPKIEALVAKLKGVPSA